MGLDIIIKTPLLKENLNSNTRSYNISSTYKRCFPEAIYTLLCPYLLKAFAEQLNVLNVDGDRVTPLEKFSGTTVDINPKNHHEWVCPVYVLGAILQGNIYGLPKWEP